MPPKRNNKRKAAVVNAAAMKDGNSSNSTELAVPDRATWPGWVEMESEPAFFNVMLTEMGVRGVKVQEVYDMDQTFLLTLPQPVHALIFLFRYKETECEKSESCPKEVWFANQTPDFACATFALLNIVNNIPGLHLGAELQKFRHFTKDMDPLSRGDAIDDFQFVKRIHNSFARDNDLLQADMHMKGKVAKFRKRQAIAKATATKAAKRAELEAEKASNSKAPLQEKSSNIVQQSRTSDRAKRPTSRKSPKESAADERPHDEYKANGTIEARALSEEQEPSNGLRRSGREPKPRKPDLVSAAPADDDEEEGFHFVAYMPINGNVWRLDGLDRFPQVVGPFSEESGGWMQVARPHLVWRMEQYAASEIQFNLMAIVHDPLVGEKAALVENIKALQAFGEKLDAVSEDWQTLDIAETKKDVVLGSSLEYGITAEDLERSSEETGVKTKAEEGGDLLKLIDQRREAVMQQAGLRAAVRDSLQATRDDEEKARHRRHDYGTFARSWLGALADQGVLTPLIEG
ncbi:hypothetical protein LTR17_017346 [Elasticomyces elasticus]|nr:hypothetical protein LTR17_017346 [Elasticomyces elasticus]